LSGFDLRESLRRRAAHRKQVRVLPRSLKSEPSLKRQLKKRRPMLSTQPRDDMTNWFRSNPAVREAVRAIALGLPFAILCSILLAYGLLLVGALDSFGRAVATTLLLPVLIAGPLLAWIGVQRARLRALARSLTGVTSRDPVTGLMNGIALAGMVDDRRSPARAGRQRGAFLVVDTTRLDAVNRTYGFAWRDEALRHIAGAIRSAVRAGDLVARTGPDSFGVFLAGAEADDALVVGERIRSAVAATYFAPDGVADMLEVVVGGVVFEGQPPLEELYVQAIRTIDLHAAASSTTIRNISA
jgi:diguanylate cyclase